MKKLIFTCLALTLFTLSSFAQADTDKAPKFTWDQAQYNFGETEQNNPVIHTFKFTNTGNAPLIISKATASCSCTVADYTKEPVMPGKSGYVKATYNANHLGAITKQVTVTANTKKKVHVLTLKGDVVKTSSKK